jgi:hypothetical protein
MKNLFLLCLLLLSISCSKEKEKDLQINSGYDGNYTFTTYVYSWMGSIINDSVIVFDGKITGKENNVLEIVYGPKIKFVTTNTSYAPIFCEGTIYPVIGDSGQLSYPDYLKQDIHYSFSGYLGPGAGYTNEITGIKK